MSIINTNRSHHQKLPNLRLGNRPPPREATDTEVANINRVIVAMNGAKLAKDETQLLYFLSEAHRLNLNIIRSRKV